jgi:XTP/dITP diphosphohydrolase
MPRKILDKQLLIATHNQGKLREIAALLLPFGITAIGAGELNLEVPEETGTTYLENAIIKAKACALATNLPSLGDDSGLEVAALNNAPGLDTAPFTEMMGGREKVFELWGADAAIKNNPKATFVCFQVIAWPDGHIEHFDARASGRLTFPPRGNGGHGYDPVFIPDGFDQSIGEMTFHEKNSCSHRFLALQKVIDNCIR